MSLSGHDFMLQPGKSPNQSEQRAGANSSGTYQYTNTTLQHNNDKPVSYPGLYATDLIANRSLGWLDEAAKSQKPFFLAINPVNPHENLQWGVGNTPPVPAARYANLFPNATVPRTKNFNPDSVRLPCYCS